MSFAGSLVDIAIGAAGMWAVQTLGWPYIKAWLKKIASNALKGLVDQPTPPTAPAV